MAKDFADISRLELAQDRNEAKRDAVSKMVKVWESKNAKRALQGAGLSTMAVTLAACGGSSTTTTTTTPATPVTPASQSFVLTTAIDALTGGAGADTFTADDATLGLADTIVGGGGVDTLRIFDTGAADVVIPQGLSGVENLYIFDLGNALNVTTFTDVTSVELDALDTAVTLTVTTGQGVVLDSTNVGGTTTIAGNTPTTLTVTVDGIDSTSGIGAITEDLEFTGTALTTLNIVATNAASAFEIGNNGGALVTLNISGDQDLNINLDDLADALVTTVNAGSYTGDLDLVLDDDTATNVAVTGGAGNDEVDFGAILTQADSFDGGAGRDILEMTQASATTIAGLSVANLATFHANLSNVEVVKISDAVTASVDADDFENINDYIFMTGISTAGTITLSNVTSGVRVEQNAPAAGADDILAVVIDNATVAGNNADVLNLVLSDRVDGGAAAVSHFGVLNAVGVDILNITSSLGADENLDDSTATGNELDIANTTTALKTLTVTGNLGLDIGDVGLVNTIQTIDASGLVLSAVTAAGLEVVVAANGGTGVTITGSNGVDTITGGSGSDIISGGSGADVIDASAGTNTITGGAGADVFLVGGGTDTITDFAVTAAGDDVHIVLADINAIVTDLHMWDSTDAVAATDTVTVASVGGAFDLGNLAADTEMLVLEGNFADASAVETAIEVGGSRELTSNATYADGDGFLLLWDDGSNSYLSLVQVGTAANWVDGGTIDANDSTVTNIVTFTGIADATTIIAAQFADIV